MWLSKRLEDFFEKNGAGDLYYIISAAINSNDERYKKNYIEILSLASEGYGIFSSEGTSYSLNNDWDYPDQFNEVYCFIGYVETSSLSFDKYIEFISYMSDVYMDHHKNDVDQILYLISKIRERFKPFCSY
ncbi:hypothetical protein LNQ82_00710 [Conchiformibius steedae DSM 2580]|uniref:CDI immunity protein domain-containing protein n=1 Tax=Conchiformibius steedae DSM 2580 TaxID=1121352 RepID=A0AAE9KYJ9_9NEIS|nr:hypothetical protein [Conchiformibius steedae]QMT33088.1 hypothetical protein H3L98_08260 [Conchiformibius steedae]URD67717.1 hypothetical protein LNQ82_00710 [Conchiformibius steedae DSM 2580]